MPSPSYSKDQQMIQKYLMPDMLEDKRVHVVLYCMPTRTRLETSEIQAMKRLFASRLCIPVMSQVCSLTC